MDKERIEDAINNTQNVLNTTGGACAAFLRDALRKGGQDFKEVEIKVALNQIMQNQMLILQNQLEIADKLHVHPRKPRVR